MPETAGGREFTRVLVVEDDYAAARLFQLAFKSLDCETTVILAEDGPTALNILREDGGGSSVPPELVVLDLDLPGQSGLNLLREFRSTDAFSTLPVVVFSNHDEQEIIDQCYAAGANAYIVKPDDYVGLTDVARQLSSFWGADQLRLPSS